MQGVQDALVRLRMGVQAFVAEPSVRFFHAAIDDDLRLASLEVIASGEHHADNDHAFFFFEAPVDRDDDWAVRVDEFAEDWADLVRRVADDGGQLAPMVLPTRAGMSRERFVEALLWAKEAIGTIAGGLVVVFAPAAVTDAERWRRDVAALLEDRRLATQRFVVVEPPTAPTSTFVAAFGGLALGVSGCVSAEETARDVEAMLAEASRAPSGASPQQLVGGAGPKVAPPPRASDRERDAAALAALASELGVPPGFFDGAQMQALRTAVLGAALAMQRGEVARAVTEQDRAAAIAAQAGLGEAALVLGLIAGTFLLQAGEADAAEKRFVGIRERALAESRVRIAAQAELARGATLVVARRTKEAAEAYDAAGRLGEADVAPLSIEGYRTAGQLWATSRDNERAGKSFREAIRVGTKLPPEEQPMTSAAHAARELADLCEKHGQSAQATSLRDTAARLEAGTATGEA